MTRDDAQSGPVLRVAFFRSASGREPVREWLLSLSLEDRRRLGRRIKAAQYGWPIGMPVVRKLESDLWEVRATITGGIARVVFTVDDGLMLLLHAFVKKSAKTPAADLRTARRRLAATRGQA
jgi:phage-related protein